MPTTDKTPISVGLGQSGFEQTAVAYAATIRIGPSPSQIAIEAREVERYVERCTYAAFNGGCYPPPPSCSRVSAGIGGGVRATPARR